MRSREDIISLQNRIKYAASSLAELKKTPQAMRGDSWVMYRRLIKPNWDYEIHNITDPAFNKTYKVTYNVSRPDTGFMLWYENYQFDSEVAQNMRLTTSPVRDDPYSIYMNIQHVEFNSDPGGISVRFDIFSPQKGTVSIIEI